MVSLLKLTSLFLLPLLSTSRGMEFREEVERSVPIGFNCQVTVINPPPNSVNASPPIAHYHDCIPLNSVLNCNSTGEGDWRREGSPLLCELDGGRKAHCRFAYFLHSSACPPTNPHYCHGRVLCPPRRILKK